MNEIWKDIEGYKGKYQVSDQGRVKSLNYNHTGYERVLKPRLTADGYLHVGLCKDNKMKNCYIHRLVAEAFIPNPSNKPCLDHINTIKTDNRVDNLRWVTHKENRNNLLTIEHFKISNIGKQSRAKKVFCENTIYDSITKCALHYGVYRRAMGKLLTVTNPMPADFKAKGLKYYIEEEK